MTYKKIVESLSDLPDPDSDGNILVDAQLIELPLPLVLPDGVSLLMPSGSMIQGTHPEQAKIVGNRDDAAVIRIQDSVSATGWARLSWVDVVQNGDGPVLNFEEGAALKWLHLDLTQLNAMAGGPLGNIAAATTILRKSTFVGFSTGLTFSGTNLFCLLEELLFQQGDGGSGNACVDLMDATFQTFRIRSSSIFTEGDGIFLTGLAASGNIVAQGLGEIIGTEYIGTANPLDTIVPEDIRWRTDDCPGFKSSLTYGRTDMTGNATANTFSGGADVYELVAGTSTIRSTPRFDDGAGSTSHTLRLMFTPLSEIEIHAGIASTKATDNEQYTLAIRRNGTPIIEQPFVAWPGDVSYTAVSALVEDPVSGDEFDLMVQADGHTDPLTVIDCRFTARQL